MPATHSRSPFVVLAVLLSACGTAATEDASSDRSATPDTRSSRDAAVDALAPLPDVIANVDVPGTTDATARADTPSTTDAPRFDAPLDTRTTDTGSPIDVRADSPASDVPRTDVPISPPDGGTGDDPFTRSRSAMCTRWLADRGLRATTRWTPGPTTCDPGTLSPAAHDDAMRNLNLYRWLSGVATVATAPTLASQQQQCAIMMHVNSALSHTPPTTWMCYTAAGAMGAGSSNLARGASTYPGSSVQQYIDERGSQLGHRRWCLYGSLGATWFGATSQATCMQVFQRAPTGTRVPAYVAYPNPGFAPVENTLGHWSVQPGTRSVSGGTVAVVDESTGMTMPTTPFDAGNGYGGGVAVAWTPNGWTPQADRTYRVTITYSAAPMIQYTVTPVRCM